MKVKSAFKSAAFALLFALVIAAAALPAVFNASIFGYLPIIALLVALLISLAGLLIMSRSIAISSEMKNIACEKGGVIPIELRITNSSFLFCPKATAKVFISDIFGAADSEESVFFSVATSETVDFGFDMQMKHIGMYSVGISEIRIYDLFGIFSKKLSFSGQLNVFVTPRIRSFEQNLEDEQMSSDANYDTAKTVFGGTDYTGVREYELGDPMKQIHWKMSAHTRSYVTKLHESSLVQEFAVFLDFSANAGFDRETLMDINDALIETALSVTSELAHLDAGSTLLYCDRNREVCRSTAKNSDSFVDLIQSFSPITENPDMDYPDVCRILRQEGKKMGGAKSAIIVTSRITADLVDEILSLGRQKKKPVLYFIVPAAFTSRERESAAFPLKRLDDFGIKYYLIST